MGVTVGGTGVGVGDTGVGIGVTVAVGGGLVGVMVRVGLGAGVGMGGVVMQLRTIIAAVTTIANMPKPRVTFLMIPVGPAMPVG